MPTDPKEEVCEVCLRPEVKWTSDGYAPARDGCWCKVGDDDSDPDCYRLGYERLLKAVQAAPHAPFCLSFSIIEGRPPIGNADKPQVVRPRIPHDESMCNCWKRAALAPNDPRGAPPESAAIVLSGRGDK